MIFLGIVLISILVTITTHKGIPSSQHGGSTQGPLLSWSSKRICKHRLMMFDAFGTACCSWKLWPSQSSLRVGGLENPQNIDWEIITYHWMIDINNCASSGTSCRWNVLLYPNWNLSGICQCHFFLMFSLLNAGLWRCLRHYPRLSPTNVGTKTTEFTKCAIDPRVVHSRKIIGHQISLQSLKE